MSDSKVDFFENGDAEKLLARKLCPIVLLTASIMLAWCSGASQGWLPKPQSLTLSFMWKLAVMAFVAAVWGRLFLWLDSVVYGQREEVALPKLWVALKIVSAVLVLVGMLVFVRSIS